MQPMQGSTWRGRAAGVVVGALALCGIGRADTICVPDDYGTIHAAINAAMDGDEICVAPGTYNETIDLLGKAVRLYSTDGPEVTVLDARGTGTAVKCRSGEGPDTVLEGFTITGGNASRGGGMFNDESSPTVTGCTFEGNAAVLGGGMYNHHCSPAVTNCTFTGNTASDRGGGMYNKAGRPLVTNCRFTGNAAGPTGFGGGVYNFESAPRLTNCSFTENTAVFGGGMCSRVHSTPVVTNCTFIANDAPFGRAIACYSTEYPSWVALTNCILWDGGGEVWSNDGSTIAITYSDVHGGYEGFGNIDADPLCDASGRPLAGSPCIDAGANNAVPADRLDLDRDGMTFERVPIDLDGGHRFMDDGGTGDTGCGLVIVDMGAHEFAGEPMHPVLIGDIDGDGGVGFDDLVQVLSSWGECDSECCPADVDFTWKLNFDDLLIVLDNWS